MRRPSISRFLLPIALAVGVVLQAGPASATTTPAPSPSTAAGPSVKVTYTTPTANPLTVETWSTFSNTSDSATCTLNFGDGASVGGGLCDEVMHTYAKPGTYTMTAKVTDASGQSGTSSTKVIVSPVFVPTAPTRLLDTRGGLGAKKARVATGGVVRLRVNGAAGISTATSATLNLTVVGAAGTGFVTAYPDGTKRPTASNVNYVKGQTVANLVDIPVPADGLVDFYVSKGPVDLVADVEGYRTAYPNGKGTVLSDSRSEWGQFFKILDTRDKNYTPVVGKIGAGKTVTFDARVDPVTYNPTFGYGTNAEAAILDVTETNATASSYVTAYQAGTTRPTASALNFAAGETRAATVVVPVDSTGKVTLYNHAGSVNLTVSVEGYYVTFATYRNADSTDVNRPVTTISPVRVLDTRNATGAPKKRLGPSGNLSFKAAGIGAVPATATSVVLNLTAVNPSSNGFLDAWGDASPDPGASALNFMHSAPATPVLLYLPVSHGHVDLFNPYGTLDVVADVEGYTTN
jgi:hypothetical protein